MTNRSDLLRVLRDSRELLARPPNDFTWSSWENAEAAYGEIDYWIGKIGNGEMAGSMLDLEALFAPTGPMQEVSLSSGWADEFLIVAERFDQAIDKTKRGRPRWTTLSKIRDALKRLISSG